MKSKRNTPTFDTNLFKYQPDKIEVGTLYHYLKSNLDGSNPAIVSVYIASKGHIEVLKVESSSEVLAYVTADMNWDIFCPDHMLSWHILPDGNLRNQAISSLSMKDHSVTMWVGDAKFHSKVTHYPVHNYTFDFTSLNVAFKHLINPYESFEIGIVEPNWDIVQKPGFNPQGKTSDVLVYRGKVKIEYIGDDLYHYHICHKYQISGKGLGNQTGTIWVSKEKGHFVNFEYPRSDNPAWSCLRMELQSIETMTAGEWHHFIHVERERNNNLLKNRKVDKSVLKSAPIQTRLTNWIEDIDFFTNTLENNHPYLYHDLEPDSLHQAVTELKSNVEQMADHKIIVELGRILAMVEDGHTSAFLGHDMLRKTTGFRKVPFVLQYFADGLFVSAAKTEHEHCIGAKVNGIGNHPLDAVEQALIPLVCRSKKNKMKVKQDLPDLMLTAEVLHAVEICEDMEHISYKLEDSKGEIITVVLEPIGIERGLFDGIQVLHGSGEEWLNAFQKNNAPTPLYLSNSDTHYWFKYLENKKAFYFQYKQVADKKEESFSDFCGKMFKCLDRTRPEKFIIDIRLNPGGSGPLNWYLIKEIKNREWLNQKGKLFTMIGRGTFSATMMAAVALERQTETIFVGEPTSASPNHFGESNLFTLPNSGATMMHSSIYWQLSDPNDDRPWIVPDIPVKVFSKDFISGEDPTMDAILDY